MKKKKEFDHSKYFEEKKKYMAAFQDIIARQTDGSIEDHDAYVNALEDVLAEIE